MSGSTNHRWQADIYDTAHSYVWEYGRDLVALLNPRPGERILDLGCGTGQLSQQIAESGAYVIGIDSSPDMVRQARNNYPQIAFEIADARSFFFETRFDAVFSNAALHWVREQEAVLHHVWQALKPGGRFVAELGGQGNILRIMTAVQQAARAEGLSLPESPWYFPSLGAYATLLESCGFRVVQAAHFDRPTALEEGPDAMQRWLEMFAAGWLDGVPAGQRETIFVRAADTLRPALYQGDSWQADYVRLRVIAVRQDGSVS